MHVCMNACMLLCVACVYVCINGFMQCMYVCDCDVIWCGAMHACMYDIFVYAWVYTCMYVCMHILYVFMNL